MISEEGAAHIIANELGIDLLPQGKLKIREVYAGMRNLSVAGKTLQKFEIREFPKGEGTGKVASLLLGDETGTVRVVFWNDQVKLFTQAQENDILLLKNVSARENRGMKEIHLGDYSSVDINPVGEKIESVRERSRPERKEIKDVGGEEENVKLFTTIVQVFDPHFFNVCSSCNRRVTGEGEQFRCPDHGLIRGTLSYVLNAILDDGTGTIRGVFWKNQTNHLLGKEEKEMLFFQENKSAFEDVKTELLGEQLNVTGRVKNNQMFNRLEFVVDIVEKANPEEEIARLEKGN